MTVVARLPRDFEPVGVRKLPRDRRGYPVPWFVVWQDGEPQFPVIDPKQIVQAVDRRLCWVCGRPLTGRPTFVIGPMCAVNRISAEPPCHRDCAIYAARHCPFLIKPRQRRSGAPRPDGAAFMPGHLARNPGAALVWGSRFWQPVYVRHGNSPLMFDVGSPEEIIWVAEGRDATRDEIVESIESGLPSLREIAAAEGPLAESELAVLVERALPLLPAA